MMLLIARFYWTCIHFQLIFLLMLRMSHQQQQCFVSGNHDYSYIKLLLHFYKERRQNFYKTPQVVLKAQSIVPPAQQV